MVQLCKEEGQFGPKLLQMSDSKGWQVWKPHENSLHRVEVGSLLSAQTSKCLQNSKHLHQCGTLYLLRKGQCITGFQSELEARTDEPSKFTLTFQENGKLHTGKRAKSVVLSWWGSGIVQQTPKQEIQEVFCHKGVFWGQNSFRVSLFQGSWQSCMRMIVMPWYTNATTSNRMVLVIRMTHTLRSSHDTRNCMLKPDRRSSTLCTERASPWAIWPWQNTKVADSHNQKGYLGWNNTEFQEILTWRHIYFLLQLTAGYNRQDANADSTTSEKILISTTGP